MSERNEKNAEKGQEVAEKATRHRFAAAYKAEIVAECDACAPGKTGAVLRREGLYSSMLTRWRADPNAQTLGTTQRGRKANPKTQELARLKRENERLAKRLW